MKEPVIVATVHVSPELFSHKLTFKWEWETKHEVNGGLMALDIMWRL